MSYDYSALIEYIETGEEGAVPGEVEKALKSGQSASDILDTALIKAMDHVGQQFREGELFIPEVLTAANAMQAGLDILDPLLAKSGDTAGKGVAVIGTVKGDLHDIGKKIVSIMLKGAGYKIIDLGVDVEPADFVREAKENKPDLLLMSAMLTTTMPQMKTTVELLKDEGLYDGLKVMIGGAPVQAEYAKQIGAHYSFDAASAVGLANELMSG